MRKSVLDSITNDYFYCVCSGSFVVKDRRYKPLVCKTCSKNSHWECTRYSGKQEDFECILCKVHLLDPFNSVEDFLWYDCIGNTSLYFLVDATNLRKWRSNNKDVYMACIPLNKESLQHEWPKTFQLKINNDTIHVVKEPSWEHKRRDNPIKITYAMRTGENVVNISSTTYNENEPLFLLIMFVCKQVTVENIVETVKKNHTIPYDEARDRVYSILNTKIGDDEIVCMESTHKIELSCPVTMDKILIPTRGRFCKHIQCYDLSGYLKVMERTSAFNMRWKCPECHLIVKPYDLVVDTFVEKIINEMPNVKAVELDKDLNYRKITETSETWSENKPPSDDEKFVETQMEKEEKVEVKKEENIFEVESDGPNTEVILISDDDGANREPTSPKPLRFKKDGKTGKEKGPTPKSRSSQKSPLKPSQEAFDQIVESSEGMEKKRRRRKLKRPALSPDDFAVTIDDSTLAECVKTFNQSKFDAFSNSTPNYENFVLNPPVIYEQAPNPP